MNSVFVLMKRINRHDYKRMGLPRRAGNAPLSEFIRSREMTAIRWLILKIAFRKCTTDLERKALYY